MLFINWNPDLIMFHVGAFAVRWYSMCWLLGLALAYFIVKRLFTKEKLPQEKFEPLFIYCFVGILIGARLGHCIFYEPQYYLTSWHGFLEMLLPIHISFEGSAWANLFTGEWNFVGYEGLASHGGTLGLMITLALYSHNLKVKFLQLLDFIAIATPVTAFFIRMGNLFNSEIVGRVTDVPWAFIFERVDMQPRHPGQLYEALAYLLLLFIGLWLYRRRVGQTGTGFYFGLCLTYIFTFRFFIENVKENQVGFENTMTYNMGQLLSVPFILIGIYFLYRGLKKK